MASAGDGYLYIVKFASNPQGPNVLFNEAIGSALFNAFALPTPTWNPILLTDDFIDRNVACWVAGLTPDSQKTDHRTRPQGGLCFGSRYLGGGGKRLLEILPGTSFNRIQRREDFWLAWLVDICAGHSDHRQAVFQEEPSGRLRAFFVDHGNLFRGPHGDSWPNFASSRYLDSRIYPDISSEQLSALQENVRKADTDQLWRSVEALPESWKTESALAALSQCVDRLSNREFVRYTLHEMVSFHERSNACDEVSKLRVLYPGVQRQRDRSSLVPKSSDHIGAQAG